MTIKYKVIYTKRKSLAIIINNNAEVCVRAPKSRFFNIDEICKFVESKKDWIAESVSKVQKNMKERRPELSLIEKKKKREDARNIIVNKVEYFAKKYNFKYSKIRLSSAKTRWGSCSIKGTISINWNLIFAPEEILDYVIIHELCHTKQHNHSDKFWNEVSKIIPDYKNKRMWLKNNGHKIQ